MIKLIKNKSIGSFVTVFTCICVLMVALFTGCTFGKTAGEAMENETSQTKESIPENVSFAEETTSSKSDVKLGTIELSELIKQDIEDIGLIIPVLVIKNNDVSDEEVYEKVIEPLGKCHLYDNRESYFRNNVVHLTPEQIKSAKCPDNMSLSFDKAYPSPTPSHTLGPEDLEKTIKVDEFVVTFQFDDDELFEKWKQMKDAGVFATNEECVAAKRKMYSEYIERIITDYEITDDDLVYNSGPSCWITSYVTKEKLSKMMSDDRFDWFAIYDLTVCSDFW